MAREASPLTLAVRQLLVKSKGKATASEMIPQLEAQGFKDLEAHPINQIKANWKASLDKSKSDTPSAPKTATSVAKSAKRPGKAKIVVTQDEALSFVREKGGLKAAKLFVQREIELVRQAENALAALV